MLNESGTDKLLSQLFDNQPDAVVWFCPLFEKSSSEKVIDFEVGYCNRPAARTFGVNRSGMVGTRLLSTPLMDEASAKLTFQQCLDVWNTGEPVDYTHNAPGTNQSSNVKRSKVGDGIVSITRHYAKEQTAELQLQKQEKRYQTILDTSTDGVLLLEPVRSEAGSITDFRMLYCNRHAVTVGKIDEHYEGKTLLELLPHLRNSEQFTFHIKVAETGEPVRYETTFKTGDAREYGWFIVTLTRVDNDVVSRFTDITDRKRAEEIITGQASLFDRIINASPNGIFACEAVRDDKGAIIDLRYTHINEMYKQMVGKKEEEVIGKTMLQLFPTSKSAGVFDTHCGVVESGNPERFQLYYKGEGLDSWYDISSVKLGNDGVMVTFADITRQQKSFLEVERQKILLDNLLQHSPSGISVIEAIRNSAGDVVDFRNILLSDRAAQFTGLPKDVLLTKTNVEIDPHFAGSATYKMLMETLQTGEACYTDYYLEPTGRWIEGGVSKMDDDRLICIITDVTTARETQVEMKSLVEDLKRSNESLEEFAYAASHDLQEPLRKIQFFSERLRKGFSTGSGEENITILERMESATTRMRTLIEDLLTYSQVSSNPDTFNRVKLTDVVEMIIQDFEPVIAETGALVTHNNLPEITGDERQLRQLFQNLVGNALKYRRPGVVPQVSVQCKLLPASDPLLGLFPKAPKKAHYLIEITDNGIGFEQEYAEKIFTVFTRLHGNSEYAGTGIGLAIVQKVVVNHKGFISAESTPGNGATFRVLLPVH